MNPSVEIVRYESGHKEQVLRLQRHLWGRDPELNRAYFAWKYENNPYLPEPSICLALHSGEVVGMRGVVGARWRVGTSGRTVDIPFVDDFVIAPEYRGQGVATPLLRETCAYARELGYPFALSLRASPLTLLTSLAAGFRHIGAMEPVGRIDRQGASFLSRTRQILRRIRGLWRWADSPLLQPASERHPFRHLDRQVRKLDRGMPAEVRVERTADPVAMAEMVDRLPPDDRIRHVRDAGFFDWVFRNPRLEYRLLYWKAERLEGYLVLNRVLPAGNWPVRVWVSDWEGASEAVCRDLLEAAVQRGRFTQLATWTATFAGPARAMLDQSGFAPIDLQTRARGHPAALIWAADQDGSDGEPVLDGRLLTDLGNWKFRLLDQD